MKKNKTSNTCQKAAEKALELASCAYPPLFYVENVLTILKMDCFEKYTSDKFSSARNLMPISPINLLRMSTLGYLFYNEQQLTTVHISLLYVLNELTACCRKKSPDGFIKIILFYVSQLFSIGCQLAFNLYNALPDTLIERDIVAPLSIFQWATVMMKESIKLPISFIGISIFFLLMPMLFDRKTMNRPQNQAGFYAIAFFTMQLMMTFLEKYLFEFNRWVSPQKAEEVLLLMANRDCALPCKLEIKTSLFMRIWQQLFSSEQNIHIVARNAGKTTQCQLQISPINATCSTYQHSCESNIFSLRHDSNAASALTTPTIYVHPTQKTESCRPKIRYFLNANTQTKHYVESDQPLNEEELKILAQLLLSFPHAGAENNWPQKFSKVDLTNAPEKLLKLAVNAYDDFGNTVLGVAAEYGYDVPALQKLVSMGADVNKPGHLHNKLPIHWAIDNKFSFRNPDSIEATAVLKFLIENGADLTLPRDRGDGSPLSTLQYAMERKYTAALILLKDEIIKSIGDARCDSIFGSTHCASIFGRKSLLQRTEIESKDERL